MSLDGLSRAVQKLGTGETLDSAETQTAVQQIMLGGCPEGLVGAFLTALHCRGVTTEQLLGAVTAVRGQMVRLDVPGDDLMDTCGTGGDGLATLNISTLTAIVVAACGARVAKHGNRSASGLCGSAEVLAELGVAIETEPQITRRCLRELGITFLYAPRFHPALKLVAPVRRQLPFRTLFNLIGPLANPAQPAYQLLGVPRRDLGHLMARVLLGLGVTRAAVVTGSDGLDEVTLAGPTHVLWVEADQIDERRWMPEDFGLATTPVEVLRIGSVSESASRLRAILSGQRDPAEPVVLANVAACLYVRGLAGTLREGVARAQEALHTGHAGDLLERWCAASHLAS